MKRRFTAMLTAAAAFFAAVIPIHPIYAETEAADTVTILPLGDSITDGYQSQDGYRKYLSRDLTQLGYTNIDFVGPKGSDSASYNGMEYDGNHAGYSGFAIQQMPSRSGILETISDTWYGNGSQTMMQAFDPDIVLLQIGTNDILSAYNDGITDRLENLINVILSDLSDGSVVFVTTIPYIDAVLRADWLGDYGINAWNSTDEEKAQLHVTVSGYIDTYNDSIKSLVTKMQSEGKNVKFADINSVIDYKTDLEDGVHPNETGYEKMADYWTGVITDYLDGEVTDQPVVTTTPVPETTTTMTTTTTVTSSWTSVTTTTTQVTTSETTAASTNSDEESGAIVWDIDAPEKALPGETFTVTVTAGNPQGNAPKLSSAEFAFAADGGIKLEGISNTSPAYGDVGLWLDVNTGKIYMNCSGLLAENGSVVLTAEFSVPEDIKSGDYTIGIKDITARGENWMDISDAFICNSDTVTVEDSDEYEYTIADLVQLHNFILGKTENISSRLDIDKDGYINSFDLVLLKLALAKKSS